jgi:hypothetical protein
MLMSALANSLNQQGFKIRETTTSDNSIKLTAIYGSKIKVLLLKILFVLLFVRLHFITRHLPWGKRLVIDASIMKTEPISLNIKIIPYMEFIDAEEIPVGAQKPSEKFSDEYLAAVKFRLIAFFVIYLCISISKRRLKVIIVKDKIKAEDGMLHMKLPDDFKNKVVEVVVRVESDIEKKLMTDTIKVDTRKWKFNREEIYGE